uniref:Uncharacterized protein n=1 Tax=Anguilla anguilla TaxID=7936 RepID=A0A0E9QSE4_ANGAN
MCRNSAKVHKFSHP